MSGRKGGSQYWVGMQGADGAPNYYQKAVDLKGAGQVLQGLEDAIAGITLDKDKVLH